MQLPRFAVVAALALTVVPSAMSAADAAGSDHRAWIEDMKSSERGPFERIRWYCNDGSVLPPRMSACEPYGGGYQHGEWSERTQILRENGFWIANLLAGVDADALQHAFTAAPSCAPSRAAILTGQHPWRLKSAGNLLARILASGRAPARCWPG